MSTMNFYNLFFLAVVFSFSASLAQALGLNDLSILLPLPSPQERVLLLSPTEGESQGSLIPVEAFKSLPQLVPEYTNPVVYRDQLKVVGVRIDPCFVEGEGPQKCRRQIRLVWQPVVLEDTHLTTRDAAVHSFYEFDEANYGRLWEEWKDLFAGDPGLSLQIHPQLKSEGLAGESWTRLRALLLRFCGQKNLVRVTAMNVMSGEQLWIFMGFDVIEGQIRPIRIARIDQPSQGVIISSEGFQNYNGKVMPAPKQDRDFVQLIVDSAGMKKYTSEDQMKVLMGRVFEYENPTRHNPGTLDCLSCHLAAGVQQWGQANYPQWNWSQDFQKFSYQSRWNLQNPTQGPLRTNQLRAFGYFRDQPAISQRVINETAAVMQSLEGSLF